MLEVLLKMILCDYGGTVLTNRLLCEKLEIKMAPIESGWYLEQLTEFCLQKELLVITALVINIKTGLPGGYFYRLCEWYGVSDVRANQRALHATLLEEVWDYQGWSVLEQFFPIHESIIERLNEVESSPNHCCPLYRNFFMSTPNNQLKESN